VRVEQAAQAPREVRLSGALLTEQGQDREGPVDAAGLEQPRNCALEGSIRCAAGARVRDAEGAAQVRYGPGLRCWQSEHSRCADETDGRGVGGDDAPPVAGHLYDMPRGVAHVEVDVGVRTVAGLGNAEVDGVLFPVVYGFPLEHA